jgi:hypothetical protein
MTTTPVPRLWKPGVVAVELGEPLHRIAYVLRTRPHIRPRAYAGTVRLFDNAAIAQVRDELDAIDARRTARRASHA